MYVTHAIHQYQERRLNSKYVAGFNAIAIAEMAYNGIHGQTKCIEILLIQLNSPSTYSTETLFDDTRDAALPRLYQPHTIVIQIA